MCRILLCAILLAGPVSGQKTIFREGDARIVWSPVYL